MLALAAVLLGSPAWAQVTGTIVAFGETAVKRSDEAPLDGRTRSLGEIMPVGEVRYLNGSDHIEAALCRHFGVPAGGPASICEKPLS